jgi:hypothetical protein
MSSVPNSKTVEDYAAYAVPIAVALAGFNWSTLIPGNNNPFLVGVAFGFLAKFLVGIQQNGIKSWEDTIPTVSLTLGFLATSLAANPDYLAYGTVLGFVVKALGYFSDKTHPVEDALLAVGAFLTLYGTYAGKGEVQSAGVLLSLIGKTIPSLGSPSAPPPTVPTPSTPPPAGT